MLNWRKWKSEELLCMNDSRFRVKVRNDEKYDIKNYKNYLFLVQFKLYRDIISSSEAKQAQPQCLCGVAPFFLYGVMRAILHFRLYFFRNNFRIAYLRNGLDLLRKVVLLVIIRLAAL